MNRIKMTELELAIINEASYAESLDAHIVLVMNGRDFKLREVAEAILAMYPMSINELLDTDELNMYISDKTGNDLFISNPKRAERISEAAKHRCDGSTHNEILEDWYEFIDDSGYSEWVKILLHRELGELVEWHAQNGTLNEVIG